MGLLPPIGFTRRKLPHFHPDDAIYFVTYRLYHSISLIEVDVLFAFSWKRL